MKTLLRKIKNKKGFTLMEMLIVVAIMVILVAVSIPVFTSQLDNAKQATDDANMRAAKSVALTAVMTGTPTVKKDMIYDAENGVFVAKTASVKGYSQKEKDKVIYIKTLNTTTGAVELDWMTETDAS